MAASTQNQALGALLFLYRHVLCIELGWLGEVERPRRPRRLPVVLTSGEVAATLARLDGAVWLVASLLYGSGLRLLECLRLRVKDLDLVRREIRVRSGKGDRDRVTMVPACLAEPLRLQVDRVAALHADDVRAGCGEVSLPHALDRKKAGAARELAWQYVFPAPKLSRDGASERRHHLHETVVQRAFRRAVAAAVLNRGGLGVRSPLDRL